MSDGITTFQFGEQQSSFDPPMPHGTGQCMNGVYMSLLPLLGAAHWYQSIADDHRAYLVLSILAGQGRVIPAQYKGASRHRSCSSKRLNRR